VNRNGNKEELEKKEKEKINGIWKKEKDRKRETG
jgi:hypothetical protein